MRIRKFDGGEPFAFLGQTRDKRDAANFAQVMRMRGNKIRVVPYVKGFGVFMGGKRKSRHYNFNINERPPTPDIRQLERRHALNYPGSLPLQSQILNNTRMRYDSTYWKVGDAIPAILTGPSENVAEEMRERVNQPDNPAEDWVFPIYAEDLNPNSVLQEPIQTVDQDGNPVMINPGDWQFETASRLMRVSQILDALAERYGAEDVAETSQRLVPALFTERGRDPLGFYARNPIETRVVLEQLADFVEHYVRMDPRNFDIIRGSRIPSGAAYSPPVGYVNASTAALVSIMPRGEGVYNRKRRKGDRYDRNENKRRMKKEEMMMGKEGRPTFDETNANFDFSSETQEEVKRSLEEFLENMKDDRSHGDEYIAEAADVVMEKWRSGVYGVPDEDDFEQVRMALMDVRKTANELLRESGEPGMKKEDWESFIENEGWKKETRAALENEGWKSNSRSYNNPAWFVMANVDWSNDGNKDGIQDIVE